MRPLTLITSSLTAALIGLAAAPAMAAAPSCAIDIEANDAMQFNKNAIEVSKACKQFTVTLKHVGKLPKAAMGHNWVLTKSADLQPVATDGMAAGLDKQYVKAGDVRVIAHTKVLGPGETDKVVLPVTKLQAAESYTFFCSFPGHSGIMKGTLKLVN
ncbi:MAG: azurin [Haliea sp.]|nr:MAG: azurin [Haliea sp.]